jgi:hypothetical protein
MAERRLGPPAACQVEAWPRRGQASTRQVLHQIHSPPAGRYAHNRVETMSLRRERPRRGQAIGAGPVIEASLTVTGPSFPFCACVVSAGWARLSGAARFSAMEPVTGADQTSVDARDMHWMTCSADRYRCPDRGGCEVGAVGVSFTCLRRCGRCASGSSAGFGSC